MIPFILITFAEFKYLFKIKNKVFFLKLIFGNFFIFILTYISIKYYYSIDILRILKKHIDIQYFSLFLILIFIFKLIKNFFIFRNNNNRDNNRDNNIFEGKDGICIIIPTHSPNILIEATIEELLTVFNKNQIYIIENGESILEYNLNQNIKKYNINYEFISNKSKMYAINHCLNQIKDNYDYCLITDDDTTINKNFYIDLDIFNNYSGIGFSVKTINNNLIQKLISLEYLSHFFYKSLSNNVEYLNGCCSLWKIKDIYNIFKRSPSNDLLKSGEDSINGILINYCDLKMKQNFDNFFITNVPDSLFYGELKSRGFNSSSFYYQRNFRWYRNGFFKMIIKLFLLKNNKNFFYYLNKGFSFIIIFLILILYSQLIILINLFHNYIFIFFILVFIFIIINNFFLYIKFKNTDNSFDLFLIFLFPFYVFFICFLKYLAVIACITYYFPLFFHFSIIKRFNDIRYENNKEKEIIDEIPCVIELAL
tara:strand:+ start:4253 stop:5695 length:1443 start_codon:yes stop_codon:yes gene_type:complete